MYAVSYFTSWQMVRVSLSFQAGREHIVPTVAKLRSYYLGAPDATEAQYRLFRIRNLLNAIPFGQTTKAGIRIFNDERKAIILGEREYYAEQKEMIGYPVTWDWHYTRVDMEQYSTRALDLVFSSIVQRSQRQEPKSELAYYLSMLEAAL